jgi:hypothetical protein
VLPNPNPPFTFAKIMYNPRVPTATVLIRVLKAPLDENEAPITSSQLPPEERAAHKLPVPDYKDGTYSNELLKISPAEQLALNCRRRRVNPQLQMVINALLMSSGIKPEEITEEDLSR